METFTPAHGRALRRERLRQLIDGHGLAAVVLRRPADFAWYTGGGDSRVEHAAPDGVADLVVTADDDFVVTSTIEAPRMRSEQALGYEVLDYPWYEDRDAALRAIVGAGAIGSDGLVGGTLDLGDEIAVLRRVLDPDAVDRLRAIGRDATAAMGEAAAEVASGMTEFEAAAALQAACAVASVLTESGGEVVAGAALTLA